MTIKRKPILLIENDSSNRLETKRALEGFGYSVLAAANGEEAMEIIRSKTNAGLVLLDTDSDNSVDFIQIAHEITRKTQSPIVFLASRFEENNYEKTREIPGYGYVIKGSGWPALRSTIETAFDLYRSHRMLGESEERYRALFENSQSIMLLVDPKTGDIIDANKSASRWYGWSLDELRNKKIFDINALSPEETRREMEMAEKEKRNVFFFRHRRASGDIREVEVYSGPIPFKGKQLLYSIIHDISVQKKMEEELKRNAARMQSQVEILQYRSESVQDFLDYALKQALALTSSLYGYIYFYDEEKRLFTLNTWSKEVMESCTVQNPSTIYPLHGTGIWGEAVRQRKTIMVNDFQNPHPLKKGYPEGHVELTRFLTIPLIVNDKIVAVVGVGNKETDYDESDVQHLTILMDSAWKVVNQMESSIEISRLLEEKELLLREVHHRVKNNMNTVMGLLSLQANSTDSASAADTLRDARSRINSMMIVYDRLFRSADYRSISLRGYLEPLMDDIITSSTLSAVITSEKQIDDFTLNTDKLIPIGIIVNELLTNAMKYAYTGRPNGSITLSASRNKNTVEIVVHDDGPGLPEAVLYGGTAGFGLELVRMMLEQLNGTIRIENDHGARFSISIPDIV